MKKGTFLLDSGAFSIYQKHIRVKSGTVAGTTFENRKYDDLSYIESDEFKKYKLDYLNFIKKHKGVIDYAINLDVIFQPDEIYKNQKYFETGGVNVIPVFHLGNDVKYLERYLTEGYKYIALGGMNPNPFKIIKPMLDKIWDELLTDKYGYPIVKIHGLAITYPKLLFAYPWFSVDSSSWVRFGMYGAICVPRIVRGNYDFKRSAMTIFVSERSPFNAIKGRHINNLSNAERNNVIHYIEQKGFKLGKSVIKNVSSKYKLKENEIFIDKNKLLVEQIIESGVCNNNFDRDLLNAMYYADLGKSVPEWPWSFKRTKIGFM